jgi:tetratricopeptide (TPR) repeat protein
MVFSILAFYLIGVRGAAFDVLRPPRACRGATCEVRPSTSSGRPERVEGRGAQAAPESPDELYRHREDLPSAKRAAEIWVAQAADGKHFEASWKLARTYYWLGTQGPDAERRTALDRGVHAGEQAIALDGSKPEGHFWLAANMGALAESYGLVQGIKYRGRIKDALERVLKIDEAWQQGSADRALGWWYHRVPGLFGGSESKAEIYLRKALTYNTHSTVTLYFLSEVLLERGRTDEARKMLQQVLDAPLDPDWGPEDKSYKKKASERLTTIK